MVKFSERNRFKPLLEKALKIDEQLKNFNRKYVSRTMIDSVVFEIIPDAVYLGQGAAKIAYLVKSGKRKLVLKVIKNQSRMSHYIEPYTIVGMTPQKRNRYFVKHYWSTDYCILQRYAYPMEMTHEPDIKKLRKRFKGVLFDLRTANMAVDGGKLKIIDALVVGHPTKL